MHILRISTLVALAAGLVPALAAAETKLAVVDFRRAVYEVEEGKLATSALKRDFDEKQKQVDAKQAELQQLNAEFEKQQSVLSDAVKQSKAADLDKRMGELRQLYLQLQQDLSAREQEAMKGIFDRMSGIVKDIAEGEGFQLVIDRGNVVWALASLDITNEVIRKYNAKFPVKAEAAAAAKPAKAEVKDPPAAKPAAKPTPPKK